jgi:hypothetical protein
MTFKVNSKNKTLYQVLTDNLKVVERRIMPLLEMFKVETTFFSDIQSQCLSHAK